MTEGGAANSDQPGRNRLDIGILQKPIAEVDTLIGTVFLFPLRTSDFFEFAKLADQPVTNLARSYLPIIASLSAEHASGQRRKGLTTDQVDKLSDNDVEALASAYVSSSALQGSRLGRDDQAALPQENGESSSAYMVRLLQNEVERHDKRSRMIVDAAIGSSKGIFDQVRKSSLELGDSWRRLEHLARASAFTKDMAPATKSRLPDISKHFAEESARVAREKAEEREMLRLTAETSAKSAKTLQELADAASFLLEKLEERDIAAKQTTRMQLWIAVGSVVVSAFLTGASFLQDRFANASEDGWQAAVLSELRIAGERGASIQADNQLIRDQLHRLPLPIPVPEGNVKSADGKQAAK